MAIELTEANASAFEHAIQQIAETIQKEANVRAVFGEPVTLDRRTIVPVSQISVSFGGGIGSGGLSTPPEGKAHERPQPFGRGGGGGLQIAVTPIGFLHETDEGVAFSPIDKGGDGMLGRVQKLVSAATKHRHER